ncbi:MAG: carboxylesterase family protein, partial [Deferribacteraceae bacterium]|nr:carboxylesterase family protein [Deferribacteraceae bacterium]
IPYATAERFAPPVAVQPWTNVRDCTNFGPVVPQDTVRPRPEPLTLPLSEADGLNLNIWTPATQAGEKLPVYVWIHGGGFAMGSGAESTYDGRSFASNGIVVVTINYRLNVLGFFASQATMTESGTTGNWGILDQIEALKWVQNNIAAFGGDPNRVTVGGESAGSYSVSALIMSSLAAGLFQNAIMESGSILGAPANQQYARGNLARSIEVGEQLMFTFGAADDAAGLAKLRAVDVDILTAISPLDADFTKVPSFLMVPTFDNYVMDDEPDQQVLTGNINKVNLLWGFNSDEGFIFVPNITNQSLYEMLAAKSFGYDRAQLVMQRFTAANDEQAYINARKILGHGMFMTVMKPYADALAAKGANVYGYYFDYVSAEDRRMGMGALHADEIAYAFNNLPRDATTEQRRVAAEMHSRWVNFIKNSDPNKGDTPSGITWGKYDPNAFKVMSFRNKPTFETHPLKKDVEFMEDIMFGAGSTHFD